MRQVMLCVPQSLEIYRYVLQVRLSEGEGPHLTVILKNPSTADATRSDPTIGKVEAWARRHNFAALSYVNLFALRSTKPAPLNDYEYDYIVGADNDRHIRQAVEWADTVVAAWGNANGIEPHRYDRRIGEVLGLVGPGRLKTVGQPTRQGYPRHGLLWNHAPALSDFELLFDWPGRRD